MRTLFIIALAITVGVFSGNMLDLLDNNISWKEARSGIMLSGLAGLVLLYLYATARKKSTAHH